MNPVYITNSSIISPQHTDADNLLHPLLVDENCRMHCIEPNYASLIPPMQLRRMSRILKMGIYTGISCLQASGISKPDAIITATGKGSMIDTERFVKDLKTYHEEALNPTPFILSTYNAINGAIALQQQSTGYNQTYVHRGSSFELALYDAFLKLNETSDIKNILVGCFDELTEEYIKVKSKTGKWKECRDNKLSLWSQDDTAGTIAGEGSAFFMLANKHYDDCLNLHLVDTFTTQKLSRLDEEINYCINKVGWELNEIDMLVLGMNGDNKDQDYYNHILAMFPQNIPIMVFKHCCGEYETASGFALWLLMQYTAGKTLPKDVWYSNIPLHQPKKILYYNHYQGKNHNIMLFSN